MKLVKSGKKEKPLKGTCRDCGAKFEAKKSELRFSYDRDGGLAEKTCTECKGTVYFYD